MGDIFICGDLNARTVTEIECTESDLYIPTSFDHVDYHLSVRSSQDCIVNERGRDLIDFCVSQDLHCLNGRVELNCLFNDTQLTIFQSYM